jgi:hypothetical protein
MFQLPAKACPEPIEPKPPRVTEDRDGADVLGAYVVGESERTRPPLATYEL